MLSSWCFDKDIQLRDSDRDARGGQPGIICQ